ncbi:MAG: Rieske 2Fe-2S domain-containing protein [Hyphomicrobiaceae bacterium]|nr:Rieske 2Fe-2S domain-containing protein [Hyphomicrobiaceae bacterium]
MNEKSNESAQAGEYLCAMSDLEATGAFGVERPDAPDRRTLVNAPPGSFEGPPQRIVVVHFGKDLRAYVNSCPHMRLPLELFPNRFLDEVGEQLVCSTHGARFNVSDGECTSGPCRGDVLRPVKTTVSDGKIFYDPAQFED